MEELFGEWKDAVEKDPAFKRLNETIRNLTALMLDRTKDCMTPTELRAYSEGDTDVKKQHQEHYDSCQKYCQKAVEILQN